jgi:hypothetical protein
VLQFCAEKEHRFCSASPTDSILNESRCMDLNGSLGKLESIKVEEVAQQRCLRVNHINFLGWDELNPVIRAFVSILLILDLLDFINFCRYLLTFFTFTNS